MEKDEILQEIESNLSNLSCSDFKKLWNNIFQEEKIEEVSKAEKDDLSELLMEEILYFEDERLSKIHKFIERRV